MHAKLKVQQHDALIVIDVQNDLLAGGCLPVPNANEVIPILNRYILLFTHKKLPIFVSRDWHPSNHCSFIGYGGRWPPHCVMNTYGAELAPCLKLSTDTVTISKGSDPDREAYSAFQGTNLAILLKQKSVKRVFVGGLPTDYCVYYTVKEALAKGYKVRLLSDAVRAFDFHAGDGDRAMEDMARLGAAFSELIQPSP